MRVQVNPGALAARGIGLEDVRTALAATSVDQPKGNLENAHQSFTLDTNDQLFNAGDLQQRHRRLPQRRAGAAAGRRPMSIDGAPESPRTGAWYNGKRRPSCWLIQRQPGANTSRSSTASRRMMPQLQASIPPSVNVDLVSDRSQVDPRRRCTTCSSR